MPIFFLLVSALYFNSAAGSAWVAGGPPTEYPKAWAYLAFRYSFYGIGFIIFAVTSFIALKPQAKRIKAKLIIGIFVAVCIFATPHIKKFVNIDACLDQSGRWSKATYSCEK